MLNHKVTLTIGALLLVTVVVSSESTAVECSDCRGDELLQAVDALDESRQCWFIPKNHLLLEFKLTCLAGIGKVLENVYKTSNSLSSSECRRDYEQTCDQTLDLDARSECIMNNVKTMAEYYRDLEQCNGKALVDYAKLDLVFKVIGGTIRGWQVPHPEC